MTKLKLATIEDDKPVKLSVELPAAVHRNLVAYAEAIGREGEQATPDPAKLIAPMIERFMATDRAFGKAQRDQRRDGRAKGGARFGSSNPGGPAPQKDNDDLSRP